MGNYRFRLSDMIPNAWFYKLKDMGSGTRNRTSHSNSKQSIIKKKIHSSTPAPQNQPKQSQIAHHRRSYYISSEPFKQDRLYDSPVNSKGLDVHFPDPPRKSSRRRSKRRTSTASSKLVTSSASSGCSCRASLDSVSAKADSTTEYSASASPLDSSPDPEFHGSLVPDFGSERKEPFDGLASWSNSCNCRVRSSATDIIIDMNRNKCSASAGKFDKVDMFDSIPELELPPILTKPAKFNDMIADIKNRDAEAPRYRRNSGKVDDRRVNVNGLPVKAAKEESVKSVKEHRTGFQIRRSSPTSPGLKLRANSPRIASKKIQAYSRKTLSASANSKLRRKNLSESFAVVKSSFNPQRDFRDSMVEMILENNIRASKDLEELLACYLSLNSNEYHDLIIKVFEQIWFDLTDIQL